jgi:hypothetical protein
LRRSSETPSELLSILLDAALLQVLQNNHWDMPSEIACNLSVIFELILSIAGGALTSQRPYRFWPASSVCWRAHRFFAHRYCAIAAASPTMVVMGTRPMAIKIMWRRVVDQPLFHLANDRQSIVI